MAAALPLDRSPLPALPGPVSGAEPASSAPSLGALLKALRRRWLLASFLGLVLPALVVAAVWFGLPPPPHEASSVFHIAAQHSLFDPRPTGQGEFAIYQQGQKALLTSRMLINAALRDAKVGELRIIREQSDPVTWLQNELKVDLKPGSEYMRLSLRGDQPEEILAIVTAVTNAYEADYADREKNKRLEHLAQLKKIRTDYEGILESKRKQVRGSAEEIGSTDPQALAVRQRYFLEALGQTERELRQVQLDLSKVNAAVDPKPGQKEDAAALGLPEVLIEQELSRDPELVRMTARKSALRGELDRMVKQATRGKDEPSLRPLFDEMEHLRSDIEARRQEERPRVVARLRELTVRGGRPALGDPRDLVQFLKGREKQLLDEAKSLRNFEASIRLGQMEMERFKLEIAQAERMVDQAATRAAALEVELKAPPRVTNVEKPYVTQENPFKRKLKTAGMAGLGTLVLVLGLIGWREYRLRRIDSGQELSGELGLPLMGAVPALPTGTAVLGSEAYQHLREPLTEHVDGTRARLVHAADREGVRAVLVTSAVPREGKTTLAQQLAASLARAGHRTVLVDGDLRLPAVHGLFGLEAGPGLAEVLRVEAPVAAALRPTANERLWVLPAGEPDLRAIQALSGPRLPALVARLKRHFDYVVLDSAPVLPVVDSLLLGRHVDGVIVSVLRDVSQMPLVRSACQRLTELNIRVLGVVLNGADLRQTYGSWYGRGPESAYRTAVDTQEMPLGLPAPSPQEVSSEVA